jgi:hypothetical protein
LANNAEHPDRTQNVKKQANQMPTLRPKSKQVIFNRQHHSKQWSIVWKRWRRIEGSGVSTEGPHVSSESFLQVVPGADILILNDLVCVIEDKLTAEGIGVAQEAKKTDQEYHATRVEFL